MIPDVVVKSNDDEDVVFSDDTPNNYNKITVFIYKR